MRFGPAGLHGFHGFGPPERTAPPPPPRERWFTEEERSHAEGSGIGNLASSHSSVGAGAGYCRRRTCVTVMRNNGGLHARPRSFLGLQQRGLKIPILRPFAPFSRLIFDKFRENVCFHLRNLFVGHYESVQELTD